MFVAVGVVALLTIIGETKVGSHCRWLQLPYIIALLSAMNHVCQNTFVHWGSQQLAFAPSALFFVRCVFVGILSTCFAKLRKEPIDLVPSSWELRRKLLMRAGVGNLVILFLFGALSCIPAPYVGVVYMTKSIWASISCWCFLGERLSRRDAVGMVMGFASVGMLIYSTTFAKGKAAGLNNPMLGFGLAMAAAILGGLNSAQIRAMGVKVHYLTNVFALAAGGLVFCVPLAAHSPQHFVQLLDVQSVNLVLFCIVGICSFLMQLTYNKAYALAKAGPLILFMEAATLMCQFLADAVLGYHYVWLAWASAGAIMVYMLLHLGHTLLEKTAALPRWNQQCTVTDETTKNPNSDKDNTLSQDPPPLVTDSAPQDLLKVSQDVVSTLADSSVSEASQTFSVSSREAFAPANVTVIGAGNISHYLMCALTMESQSKVTVFATYKHHGDKLKKAWEQDKSAGSAPLHFAGALGEGSANMNCLQATEDPTVAFGPSCDCVIFSLPAPAYAEYLRIVCQHASSGTVLLGLPGVGCFEWAVSKACQEVGRPMSDFKVVYTQDVPLSCRVAEFGKKVFIRGKKERGTLLGCIPAGGETEYSAWVEKILLGQVMVRPAPALQATVGTGCMVSHGFTLKACLEEIDAGMELKEGELLWYGREDRNAAMDLADREWRQVATAMLKRLHNLDAPLPALDMISFLEMWRQWYPEVEHHGSLASLVANLSAYQWTTVPTKTIEVSDEKGTRSIVVPNTSDRKFTQDIPFSICLVVMMGRAVNVPTPTFEACVTYMQEKMGKDYIRVGSSGVELGDDLKRECYFIPLLSGEMGLDEFLNFYH